MDFLAASAMQLAKAIATGRASSRAVVEVHIAAIERVNPVINAVVQTRYEQARLEADAADAAIARGQKDLAPLFGVPCTIKENFALKGFKQVSGLVARRAYTATHTATAVMRLQEAGAIVLGTTNTPELCMWMETHNRVYGRTNNPYDPSRIVGGSSGGEGAIIGSGASPFGVGADVGGSIRFPAFFNGVFGHKPTPGIVPNTGQYPLPEGAMNRHCVTGPIARRAEDLWPLLQIMAGGDDYDPLAGSQSLQGDPTKVDVSRLRVFSAASNGRRAVASDLAAAQARAAEWLGGQGLGLKALNHPALQQQFKIWSAVMQAADPTPFAEQLGQGQAISVLPELLRWAVRRSPHTLPALALAALERIPMPQQASLRLAAKLREALIASLGDDGVLLYPPYTRTAPQHNWPMSTPFDFAYCGLFNALGFPATAVPLGLNKAGLPLGVQVVAAPGNDALCIAAAMALERQFGGWVPPPK